MRLSLGLGFGTQGLLGARIAISATSVSEEALTGSTVGVLSVLGGDGTYTFTITADPDSKFVLAGTNGENLNLAAGLDFATAQTHTVTVEADNGVDPAITRTILINVLSAVTGARTLANLSYSRELLGGGDAGDDVPDRYWTGVIEQDAAMDFEVLAGTATVTSLRDGDWSDATMWSTGSVPSGGDKVRIEHEVTYDTVTPTGANTRAQIETMRLEQDIATAETNRATIASFAIASIYVTPSGALKFDNTTETFLLIENIWVEGVFECGTESAPIPFAATPSDPHTEIMFIGLTDPGASMSLGMNSKNAVRIRWWGASKTIGEKLASQALTGATTLTLASAPTNWNVGDRIVLQGTGLLATTSTDTHYTGPTSYWGPNDGNGRISIENDKQQRFGNNYWQGEDEPLTITAINGADITFTPALAHDHVLRSQTLFDGEVMTLAPYVENLSRSIQVTGFCTHEKGDGANRRAHTMDMFGDNIVRVNVRFLDMGRTRTDATLYIPNFNEDGFGLSSSQFSGYLADTTNVRGRYPIHSHWCGITQHGLAVVDDGIVIDSTPGCGRVPGPMYIQHHSYALVHNSICYRGRASGFATETGSEIGQWWQCSSMDFAGDGFTLDAFGDRAELIPNHDGHTGIAFNNQARNVINRSNRGSSARIGFSWVQQKLTDLFLNASPEDTALRIRCPITANQTDGLGNDPRGLEGNYGHQQTQIPDFNNNQFMNCNNGFRAGSRDNLDMLDNLPMVAKSNMFLANTSYNIPQYSHQYYNIGWAMWGESNTQAVNIGTKTWGHTFWNCGAIGYSNFIRSGSLNYNGEVGKITGDWTNLDAQVQQTLQSGPNIVDHDQHDMYNMTKVGEDAGNAIVIPRTHINYVVDTALPSPYPGLKWRNADPAPGTATPRFYDETGTQHTRTITQDALGGVLVAGTLVDSVGVKWWPSFARFNAPANGGNDPKKPERNNANLTGRGIVKRNRWYQDGPDRKCALHFYDADRATGELIRITYTVTLDGEWDQDFLDRYEVADAAATIETHYPTPLLTWDYSDENVIETKIGPLAFDDLSSPLIGQQVPSAPELISRIDRGQTAPITVSNGAYRINGGSIQTGAGTVTRADSLELLAQTPAPSFIETVTATIDGVEYPFNLSGLPNHDEVILVDFVGGTGTVTEVRDGKTWNVVGTNGTYPYTLTDENGVLTSLQLSATSGLYGNPANNNPGGAPENFDEQSMEACWNHSTNNDPLQIDLLSANGATTYDFEFVASRASSHTTSDEQDFTVEGQGTIPPTVSPSGNLTIINKVANIYPDGSNQINIESVDTVGPRKSIAAMRILRNEFPNPLPIRLPATRFLAGQPFTLDYTAPDPSWTLTSLTGLPAGFTIDTVAGTISYDGTLAAGASYSFTATQTHPDSTFSPFTNTFTFDLVDSIPVETVSFPYSADLNGTSSDAAIAFEVNSFRTDSYAFDAGRTALAVVDDNVSNDEAEAVSKPSFLEYNLTIPEGYILRAVAFQAAGGVEARGFSVRTEADNFAASRLSVADIATDEPTYTDYRVDLVEPIDGTEHTSVRLYLFSDSSDPIYLRNMVIEIENPNA